MHPSAPPGEGRHPLPDLLGVSGGYAQAKDSQPGIAHKEDFFLWVESPINPMLMNKESENTV